MPDLYLPKILRAPGVRLVSMTTQKHTTVLLFSTPAEDNATGFIRVTVVFRGAPTFSYQLWDRETNTLCSYEGAAGDPAVDSYEIEAPA